MSRVTIFVDYQNSYHCAREAFGTPWNDPPTVGHIHPRKLGELLVSLGLAVDTERRLQEVRLYKGQPVQPGHPKAISASQRQLDFWRQLPSVVPRTRPLRYRRVPDNSGGERFQGEEKGVDVLLALDLALGARDGLFDVAVVVSTDTDLIPSLEIAISAGVRVETATWTGPNGENRPLHLPDYRIWNHRLGPEEFEKVRDDTNYLQRNR